MSNQPSIEGFLETLRASGLLSDDRDVLAEVRKAGENPTDAQSLATALVKLEILTAWQAEMLLKGKRRGFHLGPHVLLAPLGHGAMGHVFLAEHTMMHRRSAIKVLAQKYREDPDLLARFQVEARAIAALDHPNIVRAYDFDRDNSTGSEVFYLVMEYVEGQDLQRIVEKNGPLPYQRAAEFIRQAAVGLAHAHEAGFIHRDIKPGNLLVDNKGVLKILDLGLARLAHGKGEKAADGTWVSGTPDYIAPEQILNRPDLDGRADIYSLGLTFYFLLVGRRPYIKKTMPEILAAHCKEPLEPIDASRPDIPYDLIVIINQMTAKMPERRYRTANDVAVALQTWLQNETCGQSSRLAAFKTAALRSRHRVTTETTTDASPPSEPKVDLELAPLEESPAPSTVSMQMPGAGTHRSNSGEKPAAPTGDVSSPGPAAAEVISIEVPPISSAGDSADGAPLTGILATLPPAEVAVAAPIVAPKPKKHKPANAREKLVAIVSESPWFWTTIGGIVFVLIIVMLSLLISLMFPENGIVPKTNQSQAAAHSNGVACVRVQRTNVQHFGRSLTRSAPT